MRAIITRAGLSHGDCVEKSDLRARTCEALEKTAPANELLRLADLLPEVLELFFTNAPVARVQTLSSKKEFRAGHVTVLSLKAEGLLDERTPIGRDLLG